MHGRVVGIGIVGYASPLMVAGARFGRIYSLGPSRSRIEVAVGLIRDAAELLGNTMDSSAEAEHYIVDGFVKVCVIALRIAVGHYVVLIS